MPQLGVDVSALIGKGLNILSTIIVLLIALQILKIGVRITTKITDKTESKMDDQLVPLLEKFARIVIIGLAVLQILSYAGVNITALLNTEADAPVRIAKIQSEAIMGIKRIPIGMTITITNSAIRRTTILQPARTSC